MKEWSKQTYCKIHTQNTIAEINSCSLEICKFTGTGLSSWSSVYEISLSIVLRVNFASKSAIKKINLKHRQYWFWRLPIIYSVEPSRNDKSVLILKPKSAKFCQGKKVHRDIFVKGYNFDTFSEKEQQLKSCVVSILNKYQWTYKLEK